MTRDTWMRWFEAEGMSVDDIAKFKGVHRTTAARWVKEWEARAGRAKATDMLRRTDVGSTQAGRGRAT